ncbi:MAG: Gfo/Idh/MocA family oxidoreductase [Oligoflexia bacterium]|nr:Gfo/Idh/MocA family oxidoreductase [Oligoflexia bacterium]
MSSAKKHILVIGAGSVGKRHCSNLALLGCDLSAVDPRRDRIEETHEKTPLIGKFLRIEDALRLVNSFHGVVVSSPPKFHLEQTAPFVKARIPVLLEKPLAMNIDSINAFLKVVGSINEVSKYILLGYSYRWWPPLISLRKRIQSGEIGKPLHARFTMSAHLADWHPWEPYQEFFMASSDLGGGALLDESHFIDLMLWIFGKPKHITASIDKISNLEIATDDCVDLLAQYNDGFRATIHLDLFGRPHEKSITVTGEHGTLAWSFEPNAIKQASTSESTWEVNSFVGARNDMFLETAREFLSKIDGNLSENPTCSFEDGVEVLRVIEACRKSSSQGKTISLG